MRFVSYAQNHEDVVLWRALSDIESGFYVDVGASDPKEGSVSFAFYENGWRGLNIEPLEEEFRRLEIERPRDINLQIAAYSRTCELELHAFSASRGLSTVRSDYVESHVDKEEVVETRKVDADTLTKICERYHKAPIHFMKIDVEGSEREVLRGIDFEQIRPWIVVVEATRPLARTTTYHEWEEVITSADYDFAYFDGLNRFYIATEHRDRAGELAIPPNAHDDFVSHALLKTVRRAEEAEQEADRLRRAVESRDEAIEVMERSVREEVERRGSVEEERAGLEEQLREERVRAKESDQRAEELGVALGKAERRADELQAELMAVYGSRSWRVTKPLRSASLVMVGARGRAKSWCATFVRNLRAGVGGGVARLVRIAARSKHMRVFAHWTLAYFPALKARVRALYHEGGGWSRRATENMYHDRGHGGDVGLRWHRAFLGEYKARRGARSTAGEDRPAGLQGEFARPPTRRDVKMAEVTLHPSYNLACTRRDAEGDFGKVESKAAAQKDLDDFMVGVFEPESEGAEVTRWVGRKATAYLCGCNTHLAIEASGYFEDRIVDVDINGQQQEVLSFGLGPTQRKIKLDAGVGDEMRITLTPRGCVNPAQQGIRADDRDLGLLVYDIHCE